MTSWLTRRATLAGAVAAGASAAQAAEFAAPRGPWTEDKIIQRGGTSIHYASLGTGKPLVLLHKLGGWVADWRHIAPPLAKTHRVIAMDLPGHGDSKVNGPVPHVQTLGELAATILAALDDLGVDQFDLMGNSLGGCVGVVMAALWPNRVSRLVLLSVALAELQTREQLAKSDVEAAGTWGPNDAPLPRPFDEQSKRFGFTDPAINDEQNASRAKAGAWVHTSERGVYAGGVADHLPRIAAPTLLLYGERGGYHEYEAVGKARIKNVRSVTIPNVGSFAQQDNPQATAAAVTDFLDRRLP